MKYYFLFYPSVKRLFHMLLFFLYLHHELNHQSINKQYTPTYILIIILFFLPEFANSSVPRGEKDEKRKSHGRGNA